MKKQSKNNALRRKLIKGAVWSAPVVATVSLPKHAVATAVECPTFDSGNLVTDPSCDGAAPVGWTGMDAATWTCEAFAAQFPGHTGPFYFYAGSDTPQPTEIQQEVDVSDYIDDIDSGCATISFSSQVRSWEHFDVAFNDESQVILEYLDDTGAILQTFDSGVSIDSSDWVEITNSVQGVPGVRSVRIRLISSTVTPPSNDGYHDSVSLVVSA